MSEEQSKGLKGPSEAMKKGGTDQKDVNSWSHTNDPTNSGDTDSITRQGQLNERSDIICQIRESGIVTALVPKHDQGPEMFYRESLYIDHLRASKASTVGTWFATAATAYGTSSHTVLWDYKVPDDILRFARRDSIPCGVLELLSIVNDSETPQWATEYDDEAERHERLMRKSQDHFQIMMKEKNMSPEEKSRATRERMMEDSRRMLKESEST
jgi:hypothetical protein